MARRTAPLFLVLLLSVLVLSTSRVGEAEEPVAPTPAQRFVDAYRADDETAQKKIAGDPAIDPVDVVATLWLWRLAVLPDEPDSEFLPAATAFARLAAARPDAPKLAVVVEAHVAITGERLAAELERAEAWSRARDLKATQERLAAHAELALATANAQPTLLTAAILSRCAEVLEAGGRRAEAARAHGLAARHADALPFGWAWRPRRGNRRRASQRCAPRGTTRPPRSSALRSGWSPRGGTGRRLPSWPISRSSSAGRAGPMRPPARRRAPKTMPAAQATTPCGGAPGLRAPPPGSTRRGGRRPRPCFERSPTPHRRPATSVRPVRRG